MASAQPSSTRLWRAVMVVSGLALTVFVFGFMLFAALVAREPPDLLPRADGIVVLTGGDHRIAEAVRLLTEGRAKRLLISGVNRSTSKNDIRRIVRLQEKLFECCVDLGYAARDTIGNAAETRRWAQSWQFSRLIVVTANYHMPRSLAELSRVFPEAELIPYPVQPRHQRGDPWWLNADLTRRMLSEYVKFLPSAALLAATRWVMPRPEPEIDAYRLDTGGRDGAARRVGGSDTVTRLGFSGSSW